MSDIETINTEAEAQTEAPKAKILKLEDGKATVEASHGRIIVVRKVKSLDYYRLTKTMGASANNPATMDLAMMAASVEQIDGQMLMHSKESSIEHTITMLGFEGLAAVGEGLRALSKEAQHGTEAAKN